MSEPLWQGPLSPEWYRVADLKPRLRDHVNVHGHLYRGRRWWVLEDKATGQQHRVDTSAYALIGYLDGHRSLDRAWQQVAELLGDDSPTQDETITLLGQLHAGDLLQCEVSPDVKVLFERGQENRRKDLLGRIRNPLALRIRLLDPDRLLDRIAPVSGWLFSPAGLMLWLTLVLPALLLAASHWDALSADLSGRVLSPTTLTLTMLVFPIMKAFHELAHGLAVKRWGAEVHEAGIMFLVLFPIPYVDASACAAFSSKHRRMIVGAAGMMAELALGAIAVYVWLSAEPGMLRDVAWNVMLIAGISVVLFNGNPLMRFDAYYILADAIEIPNLGTRASGYLKYLLKRYGLGINDAESPLEGADERGWLLGYGIAAFCYRLFLSLSIALFLAEEYPLFGAGLAAYALIAQLLVPLLKGIAFLGTSHDLVRRRARALAGAALIAGIAIVALIAPAPSVTIAQGVVWPAEDSVVRSEGDGFVTRVHAAPGSQVSQDGVLLELTDPIQEAELEVLAARLNAAERRLQAELRDDRVQAEITREEIAGIRLQLERATERTRNLTVRAQVAGQFIPTPHGDLEGRFVRKGDAIGYILTDRLLTARVVVAQHDVARVRDRVHAVEVLPAGAHHAVSAAVAREVPAGDNALPSAALGAALGGLVEVEASAENATRTTQPVFQFELELPLTRQDAYVGSRVLVRFDHGSEPLWQQLTRATRQTFLERLSL